MQGLYPFVRRVITPKSYSKSTMSRKKHPKPDIEEALCYAESHGWRVEIGGAHAWGRIYCPYNNQNCRCGAFCIASIWSTPKNTGNHAKQIRRLIDNCAVRKNANDKE
jgi:hypothetical protein